MTETKKQTSSKVHPSSIIHPSAEIHPNAEIGPFCIIGAKVKLGEVKIHSHVNIDGNITVGDGTEIYPFVSLNNPQDLKYKGEDSKLEIGKNNVIREYVTIHTGTESGGMLTKIGDNCLLMIGVHIAHDCKLGNNIVMANNATLAGHVIVEDFAVIGGLSAVHQFVRIGAHAMIGGMSPVDKDVIPYGNVRGKRAWLNGLNIIGMKRRGFAIADIRILEQVFQELFYNSEFSFDQRLKKLLEEYGNNELANIVLSFIANRDNRPLCVPATSE